MDLDLKFEEKNGTLRLDLQHFISLTKLDVHRFYLSDFPYWNKIESNLRLSTEEKRRRQDSLTIYPFDKPDQRSAIGSTPFVREMGSHCYIVSQKLQPSLRFNDNGGISFIDAFSSLWEGKKRVFPYPFPSKSRAPTTPTCLQEKVALFLRPHGGDEKKTWAALTDLPSSTLTNSPEEGLVDLLCELHEVRHGLHLEDEGHSYSKAFDELDCDLFSFNELKKKGIGEKTIKAFSNMRFLMHVNNLRPSYWIGPYVASSDENKAIPSREEIIRATYHLQQKLMDPASTPTDYSQPNALTIHKKRYRAWAARNICQRPEKGYSRLRLLTALESFQQHPYAQTLAQDILDAVESFSPGISYKKIPVRRKKTASNITLSLLG